MVLNISPKIAEFIRKRVFELLGIVIILASFGLFFALATYAPDDPNFFYNTEKEIKNIQDKSEIKGIQEFWPKENSEWSSTDLYWGSDFYQRIYDFR